jgi:hypothetical protein
LKRKYASGRGKLLQEQEKDLPIIFGKNITYFMKKTEYRHSLRKNAKPFLAGRLFGSKEKIFSEGVEIGKSGRAVQSLV